MNPTKPHTLVTAEAVAAFFLAMPEVLDVHLFGSVARDGEGKDFDLALTVYGNMAYEFFASVKRASDWEEAFFYVASASRRYEVARKLLKLDVAERVELGSHTRGVRLDLFLFPQGWQEDLGRLQSMLPHEDPKFMEHIAADALHFNGQTSQFE